MGKGKIYNINANANELQLAEIDLISKIPSGAYSNLPGKRNKDYFSIMEKNLENLKKALQ